MINKNMWSTFYWILLTPTLIFRPILAEKKSSIHGRLDVTFNSGKIKPCEKYEITVKLYKEKIQGFKDLYLYLYYQINSDKCNALQGKALPKEEAGNIDHHLVFNEQWVLTEANVVGDKYIKIGSIEHKIEGSEVKYTIFKFRPINNNYDICLTSRIETHGGHGVTDAVTFNVNFQQGPVTCKPQKGQCQYKDEFINDGETFNETSPKYIRTCKCKNGEITKKDCEKKPNTRPKNSDGESDNSDSIPGTTEAPKEGGMMMVYIVAGVIGLVVIGGATYFLFFKKRPAQTTANEGANSGDELQGPNEQLSQKEQESVASKGGPVSQASGAEGKLVESQKSGSPKTSSGSAGTGSS